MYGSPLVRPQSDARHPAAGCSAPVDFSERSAPTIGRMSEQHIADRVGADGTRRARGVVTSWRSRPGPVKDAALSRDGRRASWSVETRCWRRTRTTKRADSDGTPDQPDRPPAGSRRSDWTRWRRVCATLVAPADPVGEVLRVRGTTVANGSSCARCECRSAWWDDGEARPNVTADAAGDLSASRATPCSLRGSSSARASNAAIVGVLSDAVAAAGLRPTRSSCRQSKA